MPHSGKSSSECLAAAGRNEIVATDKTGELIDIARTAMATKPEDRFESVHAFQAAIREYQSHTESVALTSRAAAELEKAVGNDDYRDYNRALFGFEEAWELWPKNAQAGVGIGKARLAYAQSAQRKGDFDLGISLLIGDDASQRELRDQLRAAQRERDARSHRLRTARRVVLGLAALVFLAVTAGIVLVSLQKAEADRLRVVAEDNEVEAKHQAGLARDNEAEAKHQAGLARDNAKEALRQKDVADQQRKNTEYEAYIALVGLAAAKIEENAFDRAVELLKLCQPERRNWEWGRLMYLCQQGTKQFAVRNRVECVALDPDAKTLVTGSRDGIARSWSIESGKLIAEHKLDAPGSYVACVAVSPIQRDWVAVGGNAPGAWLRLWNMKTGQVRILDSHQATVASVVFSRDGKRLLTGSFDNTAMLWDVASGKMVRTFRGHDWHVWQAAFSPDEKTVVTASRDGTARLWNAATGEQRTTSTGEKMPFMGHRGAVYSATFSPDGALVATCGYDKRVLLWKPSELMAFDFQKLLSGDDVPAQKFVVLEGHTAAVRAVAFSRDGRHLLSASHDNSIKIWRIGSAAKSGDGLEPATLVKTLRGHHSLVCSAAFFPQDDNFVVSGSHDGFARVWNIKNYQEQRVIPGLALQGHTDGVLTARFSQRGEFVLTASRDRTAKAWQTDTGDEVQTYREGHAFLATRAVFFRDGKALLTAGMDGTLRVWDIDTGAERLAIHGAGHAAAAAISSDGKQILGGLAADPLTPADPTAENLPRAALWDAEKGTVIQTFARHKTDVTVTVFSSDARLVFTGDANGRGNLWDGKTGRHLAQLAWHTARISAAAFRSGDRRLLTASADGTVCPWDIADPARPHPLESGVLKHGAAVTAMAAGDDGTSILTGCDDGVVRWWKLDQPDRPRIVPLPTRVRASSVALAAGGRQALVVDPERHIVWLAELARAAEASFEVHQFLDSAAQGAGAWSAEFSPDNQAIVTVGGDEARLWDLQSREIMQFTPHRSVAAANYSPDATRVVTAGWDNSARIWDARSGKTIIKLAGKLAGELGSHTAPINSAVFSPDGNQVLTASDDRNIKLWDAKSGRVVRNFTGHAASVKSAVFSSDGRRIVSASADRTARIWDVSSGRSLRELKGHNLPVLSAIYSADDRWVITGGEDNVALVWNSDDGAQLLTLKGHTAAVTSVAVLADRTRVLTGSADQTAKLWDSANGKEVLTLKGHARDVTSVSFSQDQSKALTASRDGTAAVWLTAPWRVLETKGINNNNN
jgi:WD40 repeat protein